MVIGKKNHRLEAKIKFCRSGHNEKYVAATNYLATQFSFIFPAQQPIQQNNSEHNKRNVSHVKEYKVGKTNLCNVIGISDMTGFFLSEELRKIRENHGVKKMIQECPRLKKKTQDHKRSKGGNSNGTHNNLNMNKKITQEDIPAFHTPQPDPHWYL